MKNILISGGAGFIGSRLALELVSQGHSVTVLDNLSPQVHGEDPADRSFTYRSLRGKVRFVQGDVANRSDWVRAMEGAEAVFHLAAETGTGQSMNQIERYSRVNVHGTAVMMDVLANSAHQVEKLILASSRAVYGEGKYRSAELGIVFPEARKEEDLLRGAFECSVGGSSPLVPLPTDEASATRPVSFYGLTKLMQEQIVANLAGSCGISSVILRFQNVYGPGQSLSNPYTGILAIFSERIRQGIAPEIFEDGRESRDFIYVDDVVRAAVSALRTELPDGEIFNIGSGRAASLEEIARLLLAAFGSRLEPVVSGRFRVGDIRHSLADTTKARTLLSFRAERSLESGIREFVEWASSQGRGTEAAANFPAEADRP